MMTFQLPPQSYGMQGKDGKPEIPLEFVRWPLYSSAAIDGGQLPRTVSLFNYAVGQTVSGAGGAAITATRFHTNMTIANALARPKTFTCFGVRIVFLPMSYDGSPDLKDDTANTAAPANIDQVDDFLLMSQSTWFEFKQGDQVEVAHPCHMIPSNIGMAGVAATSVNANAAALNHQRVALHTQGQLYSLRRAPFVLWNQQSFSATLRCDFGTRPTITDDSLVVAVLDGILGREVQG